MTGHNDQQAPEFTEHQARQVLQYGDYPQAEGFEPYRGEGGTFLGYTFRVGRLHAARYGWIAPDRTYGKSLEAYRSTAADMLVQVARGAENRTAVPQVSEVVTMRADDLLAYFRDHIERFHANPADRTRQAWDELDRRMSGGHHPPSDWR
ncbi:hypothetical protein SUDANB1_05643 [Streptomyces sp. enrichment culture]|uniref:hypothetical protein n=1 Tax=Streptomyces sp. enrichment culture TaxID=1795815 RepID=UPI003F565AF3